MVLADSAAFADGERRVGEAGPGHDGRSGRPSPAGVVTVIPWAAIVAITGVCHQPRTGERGPINRPARTPTPTPITTISATIVARRATGATPLQPTMERHEALGVLDATDAEQGQSSAEAEGDAQEPHRRPRPREQAEREDEVHERRGDDRGQAGAELEAVATPVDPPSVRAHPVLVHLPAVAGEAQPRRRRRRRPAPPTPATTAPATTPPRTALRRRSSDPSAPRTAPTAAPPSAEPTM